MDFCRFGSGLFTVSPFLFGDRDFFMSNQDRICRYLSPFIFFTGFTDGQPKNVFPHYADGESIHPYSVPEIAKLISNSELHLAPAYALTVGTYNVYALLKNNVFFDRCRAMPQAEQVPRHRDNGIYREVTVLRYINRL